MREINMLVTGVGGQGTILASDIIAEIGMRVGYDVKKSDVLGLAVRGGSVSSHVRWHADQVNAPMVMKGTVDYLISFEKLEAIRNILYLKRKGTVLVNNQEIQPVSVSAGDEKYPNTQRIRDIISKVTDNVHYFDGLEEAEKLGSSRVLNVIILGALSTLLDVESEIWNQVLMGRVPEKYAELNRKAFSVGRNLL